MPELIAALMNPLPPLLPGDLRNALGRALGATSDEGGAVVIDSRYAPTDGERQRLDAHLRELRCWLQPAPQAEIAIEVGTILFSMGSKAKDDSDHEALIRIYIEDLTDLPSFALRRACRDFRRGRTGNGEYAPTQAKIRAVAETHCAPWEKTRAEIARVLSARPSRASLERRAEMLALAAATRVALANAPDPHRKPAGGMSPQEIESAKRRSREIQGLQEPPGQETPSP